MYIRARCCLCCININWRHSELLMMNERAICSCRSWEFITKRAVIGLGRQTARGKIGSILRMIDAVEAWFGRLTSNKVKIRAKTNSNFCEIRKTQQTSTSPRVPVLWPHRRIVKVKPGNLRHVESENEQNIEVNKHTTRKDENYLLFSYIFSNDIFSRANKHNLTQRFSFHHCLRADRLSRRRGHCADMMNHALAHELCVSHATQGKKSWVSDLVRLAGKTWEKLSTLFIE